MVRQQQHKARIRVLGPLALGSAGERTIIAGAVPRRVLAALVLERNAVVPLHRLIDLVWGSAEPPSSGVSLRSHVSRLRRLLPDPCTIEAVEAGYRLNVPLGLVDVDEFEATLGQARSAASLSPTETLALIDSALSLWVGAPYGDLSSDMLATAEIARLEELHVGGIELRIEALVAAGHHEVALAELQALATLHPYRERVWMALMHLLRDDGRVREALLAANLYRTALADGAGLMPSSAFVELEADVAGTSSTRIAEAPLRTGHPRPDQDTALPASLTSFHGRTAEVERLAVLVGEQRLVTLLGAGGMGKTRLALEVARLVAARSDTVAWFCGLGGIDASDASSLSFVVAHSLGLQPRRRTSATASLATHIGGRRAVLVLDNCEHVGAEAGQLITHLLSACPELRILATSREPLGLDVESRWMVGPLDDAAAYELFAARFHAFDATVRLAPGEPDVSALCSRLGGMPLAIELGAAACRVLTPAQLGARLEIRPDVLVDPTRLPGRQRLDTVLNWSVDRLRPAARTVFARLSVFHNGCALDQAEQVCAGGATHRVDVVGALADLADAGLLTVDRTGTTLRYVQIEPIRQHGARLLGEAERRTVQRRHASAMAALAQEIGAGLRTSEYAHWLLVADAELANLRSAHRWSIEQQDAALSVAVVCGLRDVLNERLTTEICDWNDATVALATKAGPQLEAAALAAASVGWMHQLRYEDVFDAHRRVMAADVSADIKAQAAWAAGWCRVNGGERHAAPSIWNAALEQSPSPWHDAWLRASLAIGSGTRPRRAGEHAELALSLQELSSPMLSMWRRIWSVQLVGAAATLEASGRQLQSVIDEAHHLGALHAYGVALYLQTVVQAQLPATPTVRVFSLVEEALALWARLQLPVQLLSTTLEAAGLAFARRGLPEPAQAVFGALDERGGTLWHTLRHSITGGLHAGPPGAERRATGAAPQLGSLDDIVVYVRETIEQHARGAAEDCHDDGATPAI